MTHTRSAASIVNRFRQTIRAGRSVRHEGAESDEALVERLQRGAFGYISRYTNPTNGLVADNSRPGSPCSIAVVGFALSCYVVAVERGWLSRRAAARQVLTTLRFFGNSTQDIASDATGYNGFY